MVVSAVSKLQILCALGMPHNPDPRVSQTRDVLEPLLLGSLSLEAGVKLGQVSVLGLSQPGGPSP